MLLWADFRCDYVSSNEIGYIYSDSINPCWDLSALDLKWKGADPQLHFTKFKKGSEFEIGRLQQNCFLSLR